MSANNLLAYTCVKVDLHADGAAAKKKHEGHKHRARYALFFFNRALFPFTTVAKN